MKLFKKITKTKIIFKLRNYLNIKPTELNSLFVKKEYSISDAFLWRTDNSYKTYFKFTDLLKLFFNKEGTSINIIICDKNLKEIKRIQISKIEISNQFLIDKNLLNGLEDYGVFYIFHNTKEKIKSSLRNSCYTGFSYQDSLPSFVHGNCPATYMKFDNQKFNIKSIKSSQDIVGFSLFKKQKYKVQKYFKDFSKTEIFLNNPTLKKIKVSISNNNFYINAGCSKIIDTTNYKQIEIISNCYFLRPIVFNYKNNFLDVHHG